MDGDEEAKCEGENVEMNVEFCCCSVAKSCLTLQPHGLLHPRLGVLES